MVPSNAKAQRREDAKPTHPPGNRRIAENAAPTFCVWRDSRPSNGREPLGMESDTKTRFRRGFHPQRPAHSESAGLATSLLHSIDGRDTPPFNTKKEERQNRRASGTAAGEKTVSEESSLSEAAGFSPVTGDSIACHSVGKKRIRVSCSAIAPLRLCVFAPLRYFGRAGGLRESFVSSCLCGCEVGGRMGSV